MQTFRSKIGLEIALPVYFLLSFIFIMVMRDGANWIVAGIFILVFMFFTHILFSTYYVIEDEVLHVRCGFLYYSRIDIKTINKITETRNIISSPATSIDRMEILYSKYSSVLVSPKDKDGFIEALKTINPAIEIKKPR